MDKPELDAMEKLIDEAHLGVCKWAISGYSDEASEPALKRVLRDLVSKATAAAPQLSKELRQFNPTSEVQCPFPGCDGGRLDQGDGSSLSCSMCYDEAKNYGTGTVPLAVRDRWVAEQVIEEACCSEVSAEHGPYANVAELRVDLDEWADGRFSENAHD